MTRRNFIANSTRIAAGSFLLPAILTEWFAHTGIRMNVGIQLYTFRKEMLADPRATLKSIAELGFKEIETARSEKGHYYGLSAVEMKTICRDLGMTLRSGHVQIDSQWKKTMEEAAAAGQEYLICSSMPTSGQTVDNYKKVAEAFNKAGEECSKLNIKFGYHNHEYEFESHAGKVLYDVLLEHTDPKLVHMELDLGWVIIGGKDPLDYFDKYPARFPLWHLKDMDKIKKHSVEFGKGQLDIPAMLKHRDQSGLKYMFVEQEEYASSPLESMKQNMEYLEKLL